MRIPSVDEKMFRRMCGDEKRASVIYTRSGVVGKDAATYVIVKDYDVENSRTAAADLMLLLQKSIQHKPSTKELN